MLIKNFTLNSSHQVVVKVVREILNLFAMEVPALAKEPVEYAETDYDLLELNIENTVDSVAGEKTLPQTAFSSLAS